MKLTEIITLLKAGYTKSEISEMVQAEKEAEEAAAAIQAQPELKPIEEAEEQKEPEPDYKKMYEDTQAALKQAQQLNLNLSSKAEPVEQETAEDIILKLIGG